MGLFQKNVIPGGTAVTYTANQIFVISKAQVKEGKDLTGSIFTLNVEKSRYVREKSKFPFTVTYEGGIDRWSGLLDIALEGGFVVKPTMGWYSMVDTSTGEVEEKKYRKKELNGAFWKKIVDKPEFKKFVESRYQLSSDVIIEDQEIEEFIGESA